eukprot:COSAG03_NODE_736_length_6038_cov_155.990908_6_plen_78_part_00
MRAALVLCAGFSSLAVGQAWWGKAKLDGKSCLKVQQGINNATGALHSLLASSQHALTRVDRTRRGRCTRPLGGCDGV